jgi:hypothetical protein
MRKLVSHLPVSLARAKGALAPSALLSLLGIAQCVSFYVSTLTHLRHDQFAACRVNLLDRDAQTLGFDYTGSLTFATLLATPQRLEHDVSLPSWMELSGRP